jgi:hypothetical protein
MEALPMKIRRALLWLLGGGLTLSLGGCATPGSEDTADSKMPPIPVHCFVLPEACGKVFAARDAEGRIRRLAADQPWQMPVPPIPRLIDIQPDPAVPEIEAFRRLYQELTAPDWKPAHRLEVRSAGRKPSFSCA